jgi:hypothetical protein
MPEISQIFQLTNEDLSDVGGPMGRNSSKTRYRKYFTSVVKAQKHAEKEYGQKIKWVRHTTYVTSGDLLHTMYDIKPIHIEE